MRRVVVTGMGVISALGEGCEATARALREGRSGIGPLKNGSPGRLRVAVAAAVNDFDAASRFERQELTVMDRFTQFATVAAREAMAQSGLGSVEGWRAKAGVVMGSCVGGQSTEDEGFAALYREGRPGVSPFTVPRVMANAPASQVSLEFKLHGPSFAVASACSSANHAIGLAFQFVRSGTSDVMLAGGAEAPLSFGHLKAWEALRVLAPDTCRPFSVERRGLVLGEGSAVLVLESLEHAQARGATILGEIAGFGTSSDASHITQPCANGAADALRRALEDAGVSPEEVNYVNAHGTGTKANDSTEVRALRNVFGDRLAEVPVSSTKSLHGHVLGATGAVEAVATLLAMREGFLPPTAGFLGPDPECAIDVVPNEARPAKVEVALSNNFAFGGLNAVLVFRRWSGAGRPA